MIAEESKDYRPVNTEISHDELTEEEEQFQAKLQRQYRDLALAGSVVEPKRYHFLVRYSLKTGMHVYGLFNLLGFCVLLLMAIIARGKVVRVWLDLIYAFGVFLPGIFNYAPLVVRDFNHFWRQNVVLTAWYQVIVGLLLNIAGLVNVLVRGNCLDDEYDASDPHSIECNDVEITIVVFIATVFVIEIVWMGYLAVSAGRFLREYEKEHAEELAA